MTINNQSFTDTIRIISNCFDSNPSVNAVIGSNGNRKLKIKNLAEYAFIKTNNRNGVLVSENKKGVLLFYKSHVNPFNIKELFYELKFALSIPFKNVLYSLQRESFIKKHRIYSNYIYCWFLGVEKGGDNAVYELKNKIFELSNKENLPILIETSVEKNKNIYQRYGFEVYYSWFDEKNNITLWFMKRENK